MLWTLLIAFLLHLLVLLLASPPAEENLEQLFSQATEVLLYDLKEQPPVEPEKPETPAEPQEQQVETSVPDKPEKTTVEEPSLEEPEEALTQKSVQTKDAAPKPRPSKNLIARSLEIARLEAELTAMQNNYAQQPRVRRISSGAKMTSEEALYLRQWEKKVERIGNLNYPEEARSKNLGGRLRLMVVIAADGRILEAQLLTSSGHRLLDDAAVRILNLAAPFAPLPESIKADADLLEIIRTWQFGDGWYAN